ncbi:MAG: DUF3021 domain-containing protein [Clostridium perfringens]|nr:DUF3021 domain-containing protein [Clostridium perfringens]
MKNIIKNIFIGIAWGWSFLVLVEIILAFANGGVFMISSGEIIKQAACSMIAGVGFCVPSIIYKNQKLSYILKIIIHMGIGFTVYFSTAFFAGWIPINHGLGITIITIISIVILSFCIWFGFCIYNKHEAKKINEKLKKILK